MVLPASLNTVAVAGKYVDFLGAAGVGTVTFEPVFAGFLKSIDTDIEIVPKPVIATLDANGEFLVTLPYTNDPDVTPAFKYHVTEKVSGATRTFDVELATILDGPVSLSDLAPAGEVTAGTTTLTKSEADLMYVGLGHGVYTLNAGQTAADIPPMLPVGTLVVRKLS